MATDYSTSKFENADAEKAYAAVLDGHTTAAIYVGGEEGTLVYEAVTYEDGTAILRYDSQGFVWLELGPTTITGPDSPLQKHFDALEREYEEVSNA